MTKQGIHPHRPTRLLRALGVSALCMATALLHAQSVEGTDYYLPRAVAHFTIKVEKTHYEPGRFAPYARIYLRQDIGQQPHTSYRLIGIEMTPAAEPDTSKHFTLLLDKKHTIRQVTRTDQGQLLAINAEATEARPQLPVFTAAPRPAPLQPEAYLSADILSAGSTAKMAELTAHEIYDIRDSRNQLSRGEADFMPKDGTQLRLMMAHMDEQEAALTQLFCGTTRRDTLWTTISYLPQKEGQEVLFRLSGQLGLVDADDLSGAPYYVTVQDLHTLAAPEPPSQDKKEDKNDIGLRVAQPGKIRLSVGNGLTEPLTYELLAPQFGTTQAISGELFGKKQSSRIVLNPLTGSISTIEAIAAE